LRSSKTYKEQKRGRAVTKSDKPPKREKGKKGRKEKKEKKEKKERKEKKVEKKVEKVQKKEEKKVEKTANVGSEKRKERSSLEEELALAAAGKQKREEAKKAERSTTGDKVNEQKAESEKHGTSAKDKEQEKKVKEAKEKEPEKKLKEDGSKEKSEGHKNKKAKVEGTEGDQKKKGQKQKDSKAAEAGAEKKKQKKEPPIVYKPVVKPEIEHLFTTPEKSIRKAPPSVGGSENTEMTSKEKALQRMHELTKNLQPSDDEEVNSSCPTTDLEAFLDEQKTKAEPEKTVGEEHDPDDTDDDNDEDDEEESEEEEEDEDSEGDDSQEEEEEEDKEDDSGEGKSPSDTDSEDDMSSSESAAESEKKEHGKDGTAAAAATAATEAATEAPGASGPAKEQHALVPVAEATQSQQMALRNSVTHKPEWEKYIRQAKTMMPIQCNEMFNSSKKELFNLWLDSSQDWEQCRLVVERKQQQRNIASRGWTAKQGKELKTQYTPEKWEAVKASRRTAGLFYEDEDFPGDEDDARTYVKQIFSFSDIFF